jgi:hypothetical protein
VFNNLASGFRSALGLPAPVAAAGLIDMLQALPTAWQQWLQHTWLGRLLLLPVLAAAAGWLHMTLHVSCVMLALTACKLVLVQFLRRTVRNTLSQSCCQVRLMKLLGQTKSRHPFQLVVGMGCMCLMLDQHRTSCLRTSRSAE